MGAIRRRLEAAQAERESTFDLDAACARAKAYASGVRNNHEIVEQQCELIGDLEGRYLAGELTWEEFKRQHEVINEKLRKWGRK